MMAYVWFFIALIEAIVIVILIRGGAIDQAKAASSLNEAEKATLQAIESGVEKAKAGIDKLRGK